MIQAKDIESTDFNAALGRYNGLVSELNKKSKNGTPLEKLDHFRYVEAPGRFAVDHHDTAHHDQKKAVPLELDDLKKLMEWKLTHGHYRPTLPALIASNTPASVTSITKKAFSSLSDDDGMQLPNVMKAIKTLCDLRGVGPATASLILSLNDPHYVPFFSDELYWWLCCKGKKDKINYNLKEYERLLGECRSLYDSKKFEAIDVERVAYVLMKETEGQDERNETPEKKGEAVKDKPVAKSKEPKEPPKSEEPQKSTSEANNKRKITKDSTSTEEPNLRRSKRNKS